MNKINYRRFQLLLTLVTLFVLFSSLYLQFYLKLQPCPLCLMQRFCVFVLLGLMGLSMRTMTKAHVISFIQSLIACAGLFFAGRQLWLQSLPVGQAPACMPGLDVLIHYFPWQTVARTLLWGAGDCAEVNWTMLGISMPGWSAMYFLFMAIVSFYMFLRTSKGSIEA